MTFRQARYDEPLIFEMGRKNTSKPQINNIVPEKLSRKKLPDIPNLTEAEVVRHYTRLSQMNYGVDTGFYPLGSCTMKYTPKIVEEIAGFEEVNMHPYQDESTVQGSLKIMYELQEMLKEIGGVDEVTLQPAAGAHGEFTGLLIAGAYHESRNEKRTEVILPDTAHGTNPASAHMAGYDVIEIPSENGMVNLKALKNALSEKTAAFMLTNPNTLGIFEENVLEIAEMVHDAGALLYYDGANLNAVMGKARPGDMGFDIVHFNLHKTFCTPHGGGGPGAGPVGVKNFLGKFLPVPVVEYDGKKYYFNYDKPDSIGKVKGFYGNFAVLLKAYIYIKLLGGNGLRNVAEISVLNANYMKEKLKKHYPLLYKDLRKHEFVLSGSKLKEKNARTMDAAKMLLDYGLHAPTIYFPHLVDEAIMIEPTETEPKYEMDKFIDAMIKISESPLKDYSPKNTSVGKVDEVGAAKNIFLSWKMFKER